MGVPNTTYFTVGSTKQMSWWTHFMRNMSDGYPYDLVITDG